MGVVTGGGVGVIKSSGCGGGATALTATAAAAAAVTTAATSRGSRWRGEVEQARASARRGDQGGESVQRVTVMLSAVVTAGHHRRQLMRGEG